MTPRLDTLAAAHDVIRRLMDEATAADLDHAHLLGVLNQVTAERDTARRIACRLEEELHQHAMDVAYVPVLGEAT